MIIIRLTDDEKQPTNLWYNLAKQAELTKTESETIYDRIRKIVDQYGGRYYGGTWLHGLIIFDPDKDEEAALFVLKFS